MLRVSKFCSILSLLVIGVQVQSCRAQQIKEITELSSEELDVANGICQKALEDYFGDRIIAWYNTTYNFLPTSDEDIIPDFSKMKELKEPITVSSVIGLALAFEIDNVKGELKEKVATLEAYNGARKYKVLKSLVLVEPGGGGGSMYTSYDKVTIIPYSIVIRR